MEHTFYKKARAKDFASHARATGYEAQLKKLKNTYVVYVYRRD